jgi:hypothetical protein
MKKKRRRQSDLKVPEHFDFINNKWVRMAVFLISGSGVGVVGHSVVASPSPAITIPACPACPACPSIEFHHDHRK